ncbi:MAG: tyrosine-type recombinase/integrase [Eubacteriales bacterium]|nr:tyrosine-type recombinase/integrase [Eubacteriales bacterium]
MTKLENGVSEVLQRLKLELASETWESRRRYFNQMLKCAQSLGITKPCAELYDAFIADDNGSRERHSLHVRCVRLIDALACTHAKDEHSVLFNEPPMPGEAETHAFFQTQQFPITADVRIDYLIVKAEIEMRYLNLTVSTIGQYKHSWMDIRRYFYDAGVLGYDEALVRNFIREAADLYNKGVMWEWKWKINRKAAHVLIEVANTGCFHWGMVNRNVNCNSTELECVRSKYLDSLRQRNFSKATIGLYDYVFRKAVEFSEAETLRDLISLSPGKIQLTITNFASVCNRRSMATILPILRFMLKYLHTANLTQKDLSGIVMGCFVQRGSVAAYISEKDQAEIVARLSTESKRTNAVILLAMRLGLRDCDICNLSFRDIDWQNDKIMLNQKKTGEPLVLPLLPAVGNALMEYILNERPKRTDNYPYIFLRNQAPYNKLTSTYLICSKLLTKIGVKPINGAATGPHLFRYSMVHRLLTSGVPHQVITDTLGHVSKESDKPYLSMEESMLRMCALDMSIIGKISWRGGASDD